MNARGLFTNVASQSTPPDAPAAGPGVGRVTHERRFEGDLVGASQADLQTCLTGDGRFGYVGTDRFTGHLAGRAGTFVFQHGGVREGGELRPFGFIVPGSGTGELAGIRGTATIVVSEAGEHALVLDYELGVARPA